MADNDTPQHDRTEQPSAKRLDDARTRGEVPRSRELAMTAVVLAGAAVLLGGGGYFAEGLGGLVRARAQGTARGVVRRRAAAARTARRLARRHAAAAADCGGDDRRRDRRLDRARRLVVQHDRVDAEFLAFESDRRLRPHRQHERARRALEGAREVRDRRGRRGPAVVAVRRRFPRARDPDARGRDRPRGVAHRRMPRWGWPRACCSLPPRTCRFSSGTTAGNCA